MDRNARVNQKLKVKTDLTPEWQQVKRQALVKQTFDGTLIDKNWEKGPLNSGNPYLDSPVAKFLKTKGEWGDKVSPENYQSRTINRKMKMRDTFLLFNPRYVHEPRSCSHNRPTHSHQIHPEYRHTLEGTPMKNISKENNLKFDDIKVYAESMRKLGTFAPPKRDNGKINK